MEQSKHKESVVESVYILILIFCMSFNFADALISSQDPAYGGGSVFGVGTATCIFESEMYT